MTTQPDTSPRRVHQPGDTGRCQHCEQTRPLFPWSPAPLPWEELPGGWLCARDYSAAKLADDNDRGKDFRLNHDIVVWPEDEPKVRVYLAPAVSSGSGGSRAQDGAQ